MRVKASYHDDVTEGRVDGQGDGAAVEGGVSTTERAPVHLPLHRQPRERVAGQLGAVPEGRRQGRYTCCHHRSTAGQHLHERSTDIIIIFLPPLHRDGHLFITIGNVQNKASNCNPDSSPISCT